MQGNPILIGQVEEIDLLCARDGFLLIAPGTQLQPPTSLQLLLPGINPACTGQVDPVGFTTLSGTTSSAGGLTWSPGWSSEHGAARATPVATASVIGNASARRNGSERIRGPPRMSRASPPGDRRGRRCRRDHTA